MARMLKRSLDIFASLILMMLLALPLLMIAVVLRMQGGPVLFAHWRIGRGGRRFPCYKLRTMLPDAEQRLAALLAESADARQEWARDFKLRKDPRVTPLGEFLRKTSIDELPQLWNVLIGDMSLVGPRPIVAEELARYGPHAPSYLSVRPGITGLWQVSGRNDTSYEHRVSLDVHYVQNWSLGMDCRILVRTIGVVLGRTGAY
ncbi:sugar transferase [Chitinimonas sp. BJYL2]|uniref:sugar transferase n=1 Tax=Chitinimonas sp. BJYL2 TaxID=2976696 RepID=UPI0022B2E7BC|nr:sugar transferase [Chitinimonas sp. BJYL2]